ncbi:hypothetical protein B0H66DRAFT_327976 [Apodospora peruviana]|uniref:UmuC domain-containing protein n=1 Tax=Apodospora peruviana TaxID=516989 RepID=A0AAE0M1T8_9PEZI|nr:hypothetical protein B0H66DRAFT_327976 [Apodospora peruviana]
MSSVSLIVVGSNLIWPNAYSYLHSYSQCVENRQPSLKSLPLGIKQKTILATCNYEARRRGVKKLMLITDAKKICPELVIANGEDLSPFRDVSKRLYALLRSYSWNGKIERLGLDEMFLDVTDIVSYNLNLLNRNALHRSFFYLSRDDPERGFECDATDVAGCVHGGGQVSSATEAGLLDNTVYMRLLLASHLARYLRLKIEEEGFTTSCGISTNKLLAKLVGNKNKPRNQTTLLALKEGDALSFMDEHRLRAVPGIGSKITHILEAFVLDRDVEAADSHSMECSVTAGEVRSHPGISPPTLEKLLVGPGSEKGLGNKAWCLLHGVDETPVKPGRDIPTQISIEDTYKGLNEPDEIRRELILISTSLLRRMHVDLVEADSDPPKWMAYPKTIRLTTRPKTADKPYSWVRASRSEPLPSFVFSSATTMTAEKIVEKLVEKTLLPMFYKLNPARRGWNIGLLNVCAANMTGTDGGVASGRDIGVMFRRQEGVLREFTVYGDDDPAENGQTQTQYTTAAPVIAKNGVKVQVSPVIELTERSATTAVGDDVQMDDYAGSDGEEDTWEPDHHDSQQDGVEQCPLCGHFIPLFALTAHDRFHSLEEDGSGGAAS